MSDYPSTRLDKAILKFAPQVSKKSQNVSAAISAFFMILFGNYCRNSADFSGVNRPAACIFAACLTIGCSLHRSAVCAVDVIAHAHL
jgi:hypothetical protein